MDVFRVHFSIQISRKNKKFIFPYLRALRNKAIQLC